MKSISARDLKNQTGKVLKLVKSGQRVLITMRNKPFAVLSRVNQEELQRNDLRPYDEAWKDIEKTLKSSKPRFKSLNDAMRWSRRRS